MFVAVTSECSVNGLSVEPGLANSADSYLTPQNAASDQDLHCFLKLQEAND